MLNEKMPPHEVMVYPTLQTAWIRGKGILLFSGLYLVEFGAGMFLAASLLQSLWGQVAGWLISGALGGGCHFLFLGHPFRIYRALRRPGSSWISRGLIIISLFQFFGFVHIVLSFFGHPLTLVMAVADILALATILYGGYEIADVKAIRTWNSSFLPIQMLLRSFFIGLALVLAVNLLSGFNRLGINMREWLVAVLFINVCLFFLSLVSLGFEEGREKLSLSMMTKGDLKWMFWPWVVAGGMIVPLAVVVYSFFFGVMVPGTLTLLIPVTLQVIGDILLRYSQIRSGYYPGLFPRPSDFR